LYTDENGTVRQEPKNKFIIHPFSEEEEEELLEIKKQRNITGDSFPIIRNTEEEAVDIIEKLLSKSVLYNYVYISPEDENLLSH
jgi:predicted transcriptional regulator